METDLLIVEAAEKAGEVAAWTRLAIVESSGIWISAEKYPEQGCDEEDVCYRDDRGDMI